MVSFDPSDLFAWMEQNTSRTTSLSYCLCVKRESCAKIALRQLPFIYANQHHFMQKVFPQDSFPNRSKKQLVEDLLLFHLE